MIHLIHNDFTTQKKAVKQKIQQAKKLIQEYFAQLNIGKNDLIVDFGGGGSIFEAIDTLLPYEVKKLLFYIHYKGYVNLTGKKIDAYLHSESSTRIIKRTPEILENLLNNTKKTTIGYEKKGNKIIPLTKLPIQHTKEEKAAYRALFKGVDTAFALLKQHNTEKISQHFVGDILARQIDIPLETEVQTLGNLRYDIGKGTDTICTIISKENIKQIEKYGYKKFYETFCLNHNYKYKEILWPQGALGKCNSSYIKTLKNVEKLSYPHYYAKLITKHLLEQKTNSIYLYGLGGMYKIFKPLFSKHKIKIKGFIDSKAATQELFIQGKKVLSLEEMKHQNNAYPIVIASLSYEKEIRQNILNFMKKNNIAFKIVSVETV